MKSMVFGLVIGTLMVVFFHLLYVPSEVLQALLIFNIFFVCVYFPLNGPLKRKVAVLLAGNVICFLWNMMFSIFVCAVSAYLSGDFNALLAFLNPLLNLLWMVSFWSIGLTFLAEAKPEGWEKGAH
ncbi:MAG: hypothetical protein QW734_04330 [Candidatus Bathyarchaeia archaeon]